MQFNRIIVVFFVISLFSSNVLWAGAGQFTALFDSDTLHHVVPDNDTLKHVEVEHNDGHNCHMAAHFVGLNSQSLSFANLNTIDSLPDYHLQFSTRNSPPPNKPPRS